MNYIIVMAVMNTFKYLLYAVTLREKIKGMSSLVLIYSALFH